MRDKLFENCVENISNVIVQLKKIKEEYFKKSPRKTPSDSNNSIALPLETPPHDFMVFDFEEVMHDDFSNANAPNNNEVASKIIVSEDIIVLPAKSDKELVIMPLVQNLETIIEIDENATKNTDIQRVELTEIKHSDYNIGEELNEIMNDKETEHTEDKREEVISEIQCEQTNYSDSIVEVNRTTETSGNIFSTYKILVPAMIHNSGDCDEMIENSEIEMRMSPPGFVNRPRSMGGGLLGAADFRGRSLLNSNDGLRIAQENSGTSSNMENQYEQGSIPIEVKNMYHCNQSDQSCSVKPAHPPDSDTEKPECLLPLVSTSGSNLKSDSEEVAIVATFTEIQSTTKLNTDPALWKINDLTRDIIARMVSTKQIL
ncbi:hypothetical protein JTB14_006429 [Gonioctena quinquepunctata]|nr:hypothetical protein JTB14_006429 [Gonioctena quinquepunctata]